MVSLGSEGVQLSADSDAGQRFALLLKSSSRPLNQQTLLALLSDIVAADVGLASAFRMLLTHSVYVEFFSASSVSAAQRHALTAIAADSLAPQLAQRIADFLEGYVGARFTAAAPAMPAAAPPVRPAPRGEVPHPPTEVDRGPASHGHGPSDCPATLYERPAAAQVAEPSPAAPAAAPPSTRSSGSGAPLRLIAAGLAAAALAAVAGVALVLKAPFLCEPLGSCPVPASRGDAPGSGTPDRPTAKEQTLPQGTAAPSQPSQPPAPPAAPPSPPAADSGAGSSPAVPLTDQGVQPPVSRAVPRPPATPQRGQQTDRSVRQAPARAPSSGPPLRDEPLW
ncbi:MAG: hypothetical protein RLZZ124_279 [Cyanobacteriota bacterium]